MTQNDNFKAAQKETQRLISEKESLEQRINDLESILRSHGVGMKTPLVDNEGFPRSDIDIYAIRNARSQLAPLYNDLKSKMDEIHRALEIMHSFSNQSTTSTQPIHLEPFATITGVSPDSPANEAGLLRNDKILKFGKIDAQTKNQLQEIAKEVMENEYKTIRVEVEREGTKVLIILTPKKWNGKGLLGCHLSLL